MLLTDAVRLATQITYFVIAVVTTLEFVRHRDRTRLEVMLMFLSVGFGVVVQWLGQAGFSPLWLTRVSTMALMLLPFMLVRLVPHVFPIARLVRVVALVGLLASLALLAIFPPPYDAKPYVTLPTIVYGVLGAAYATVAFIVGARTRAGGTRWRHLLAANGSALLALVFAEAAVLGVVPNFTGAQPAPSQFFAVLSGLAYYGAFAPPRWLRRHWQFAELYGFLKEAGGQPAEQRVEQVLPFLCEVAVRVVGGRAALVATAADETRLEVRAATHPYLEAEPIIPTKSGAIGQAWHHHRPAVARNASEFSPAGARLAKAANAAALYAIPVATADRMWGVLVVLLNRAPMYPEDDLGLLALFGEQTAMLLEQRDLLAHQQRLVQQLRQQTTQLEAANRELEAFSYSVSHDLRAPLRHIEGFTDLLLRDGAGPDWRRQNLQRIADAAIRMGRLIDDLLTFSRMGRSEMQMGPVALERLAEDARRETMAEADDRPVEWDVQPLPEVIGDPALLRLVLVNLLSNALKYSRGRSPARIQIGAESTEDEHVIVVRDNGVGFDMQYAGKLFGVFQRLHHQDEFEGVGIGLANVRRIIHRHGGRTWALATPGEGAAFYFSLPRQPAAAGAWPEPPAGLPGSALPRRPADSDNTPLAALSTHD